MKKGIKRAVVFLLMISLLSGNLFLFRGVFIEAADSDVIRNDETGIPDRALYQMILKALGKTPDSTFTEAEAQSVQRISQDLNGLPDDSDRADEEQVVSLQGIEKLTNLISFSPGRNQIIDFKPLESLKNLSGLQLRYSYSITSIEGLRSLTQLKYLELPPTVTDLSPIEGMTELTGLVAINLGIRTLPDLRGHIKLTAHDTYLGGNNLTKEELNAKLPKQLVEDSPWLKQTIDLQEYNVKKMKKTLKVTSPKKIAKITSKTKKIVGKAGKNLWVELSYGSGGEPGAGTLIKETKADKNGVFKLKNLKLKKYKKKKLYLVSSYSNPYYVDDTYVMKAITFKLKK